MLARALRLTGANADAIEILATGGTTADVRALRELAHSQQATGDLAGARATLTRAIELEPDDASLREQLAGCSTPWPTRWAPRATRARVAARAAASAAATSPSARAAGNGDFDAVIRASRRASRRRAAPPRR